MSANEEIARAGGAVDWMADVLAEADAAACRRVLRTVSLQPGGWLSADGAKRLNLCSNDYLGIASEQAVQTDPQCWGAGASRLIAGNHPAFRELEQAMANLKQTEACLVFGSGFMTNVGVIPALVGAKDVVFSDRLNHASIVDGIRLSGARHCRYAHGDLSHLERLLDKHADCRRKLIVTDAIFSMDGDLAPLLGLAELKAKYGAMLMIDEAHSAGVMGPEGAGLAHQLGVSDAVDIQMGTFSKAYGCYGAYVCGRQLLIDYLTNHCRSLIYTTGLPDALIRQITASVACVRAMDHERTVLRDHSVWLRGFLRGHGFDVGASETQIIPLIVGDSETAVHLSEQLWAAGIAALAIRPPTVPEGTARLRLSLMATHSQKDIRWAAEQIVAEYGALRSNGD